MLTLLGLIILVAGFFACHISPTHCYKLHRYEGQYLYLRCADLGSRCFGIAAIVAFTLCNIPSFNIFTFEISFPVYVWIEGFMQEHFTSDKHQASRWGWLLSLSVLTFISAFIYKLLSHIKLRLRFGVWDAKIHVMGSILADSPLDNLLFNLSLEKDKYAMISMNDRKNLCRKNM